MASWLGSAVARRLRTGRRHREKEEIKEIEEKEEIEGGQRGWEEDKRLVRKKGEQHCWRRLKEIEGDGQVTGKGKATAASEHVGQQ